MKVYVLTQSVPWEGTSFYSVWATRKQAEAAMATEQARDPCGRDQYQVSDHEIDDPAAAVLAWTRERPTEPGWYWMRLVEPAFSGHRWATKPVQARIDPRSGQLRGLDGVGTWEWAGPLPEPSEPEPEKENL
jgi:hypothetical protein